MSDEKKQQPSPVIAVESLGMPWRTPDPFLFCVHHDDRYPAGTDEMGPNPSLLGGRDMGQDFGRKDGWSMYHGQTVPGFPQHPHRGFETVTVVRQGLIDHSDSMGATARYGGGDVQWLTAGKGIVHAEMFPLVKKDVGNPTELFQIWLNLPAVNKMAEPHFTMLWNDTIPRQVVKDAQGRVTELTIVAGQYADAKAPPPPPKSWASQAQSEVAIWTLRLEANATFTLPAAAAGLNRWLYFFRGSSLTVADRTVEGVKLVAVKSDQSVVLQNGPDEAELLMLQGRPIGEPVRQYGPFVMNNEAEIRQAFADYQRTQFGGWPWKRDDPVHAREEGRFAKRPDGSVEKPRAT